MIEFDSVGKTYRDGTAAVADLSLTVPSDKITVFVGPSGCGKTTTLRMVNRMIEPTSGKITWDGAPLRSKRKTTLRRQMGYVIQSGGLFPHRTVLENIGTVPALLHWDKRKIQKRSMELLGSVGLDPKLAHRYPAQLSGGQQQRVGVARALAADPLVMLMDEPFSAVDPVVRSELHDLFLGLQRQLSKTIILITHDIDEAIKLGDQVAILRVGGRLAQVGTPQELLDSPADAFVEGFVGRDRGYRSLSFLPASDLELTGVRMVRDPEAAGLDNTLVVDGNAKPLGWADRHNLGKLLPLGATFDPELDTLRLALDAALTSPYGLAVGVTRASGGRFVGVATAREILSQISDAKAASVESISLSDVTGGDTTSTDFASSLVGSADERELPEEEPLGELGLPVEDAHEAASVEPGSVQQETFDRPLGVDDTHASDVTAADDDAVPNEQIHRDYSVAGTEPTPAPDETQPADWTASGEESRPSDQIHRDYSAETAPPAQGGVGAQLLDPVHSDGDPAQQPPAGSAAAYGADSGEPHESGTRAG